MGSVVDLENIRIIKQKIGTLINDGKFSEAISNAIKIINSSDYELISNWDKGILYFKLAYGYKKIGQYKESIVCLEKSMIHSEKSGDDDHYYRALWLKNNCEIESGSYNKDNIINNFIKVKLYYESVNKKMTANLVGFTIAYHKGLANDMLWYFKKIIKMRKLDIDVEPNFNEYNMLLDMIEEIREIDESVCEDAETYLELNKLEYACI